MLLAPDFLIFLLFLTPAAHRGVDLQASKLRGAGMAESAGTIQTFVAVRLNRSRSDPADDLDMENAVN